MSKLPYSFYQQQDVTRLAADLLGKKLCTHIDGQLTTGIIVETEAYRGVTDKASHAYGGRFTDRTRVMYEAGGLAYVYLCYGIHYLFNVVTAPAGIPHAVLVRGLEPLEGLDLMLKRRNMSSPKPNLTAGPGALSKALGIDREMNAKDLGGDAIWIEESCVSYHEDEIIAGPRIGVDYAGEDALLPWRYYVKGNQFVSKPHL